MASMAHSPRSTLKASTSLRNVLIFLNYEWRFYYMDKHWLTISVYTNARLRLLSCSPCGSVGRQKEREESVRIWSMGIVRQQVVSCCQCWEQVKSLHQKICCFILRPEWHWKIPKVNICQTILPKPFLRRLQSAVRVWAACSTRSLSSLDIWCRFLMMSEYSAQKEFIPLFWSLEGFEEKFLLRLVSLS